MFVNACYIYRFVEALNKSIRAPIKMFSWKPGGSKAGELFFCDEDKTFILQTNCLANITEYHSRVHKAIFLVTVVNQVSSSPRPFLAPFISTLLGIIFRATKKDSKTMLFSLPIWFWLVKTLNL